VTEISARDALKLPGLKISSQLTRLKIVMYSTVLSVLFSNATTVSQKSNNEHEQHLKFFEEAE
jgi:hypothetical protein